jgi:hypothetical protein
MGLGLVPNLGSNASAGGGAPAAPLYVWLGESLAAAPALSGVPANSTYLNRTESTFVTRGGIEMRSPFTGTTASNSGGFASVPTWVQGSAFNSAEFRVPSGTWQVGFIMNNATSSANMLMIDNPAGVNVTRQTIALTGLASSLSNTSGTTYTAVGTAVADVVAGMTLVPVIVSNAGGGLGIMRLYANGTSTSIAAFVLLAP